MVDSPPLRHDLYPYISTDLPRPIVQTILEDLNQFDEQLEELQANAEKKLKAMEKVDENKRNKELIQLLTLND